jgi:heterodisulfide reductase subunit C
MDNIKCLACGICIERCPVEQAGGKSFLRRLLQDEDGSAWVCTSCWLCQAVCPENLDIRTLIFKARRDGAPPPAHSGSYHRVLETGYALPIPGDLDDIRHAHGLPPLKPIPLTTLRRLLLLEKIDDEDE